MKTRRIPPRRNFLRKTKGKKKEEEEGGGWGGRKEIIKTWYSIVFFIILFHGPAVEQRGCGGSWFPTSEIKADLEATPNWKLGRKRIKLTPINQALVPTVAEISAPREIKISFLDALNHEFIS